MVDDELPPNEDAETVIPPGPRRSTYTPPPAGATGRLLGGDDSVVADDDASTDDDALAGALAQEFQRWAPPTAPVVVTEPPAAPAPAPALAPAPEPMPMPAPMPAPMPMPMPEPMATPIAEPSPLTAPVTVVAAGPAAEVPPTSSSASSGTIPPPPQRISLTDAELLAAADLDAPDHDTAALLDLMERELDLRRAEARRVQEWEAEVRAAAVPEAEELVSQVRAQFADVVPVAAPPATDLPELDSVMAAPPVPPSAPGPRIDLALADAPPPYGMIPSAVAPPPSAPEGDDAALIESPPAGPELAEPTPRAAPEPLVEPSIPNVVSSPTAPPFTGPTSIEQLLAAPAPEPASLVEPAPLVSTPAAAAPAASVFDDLLRDPEPDLGASDDPSTELALDQSSVPETGDEPLDDAAPPVAARASRVEVSALEPTPAEQRAGRSVRLFWLWFAVNASVLSVALGAVILGLGVSLRQAVLAALIGVAVSFLPLGLGTLAGKWSGQPTMVVSRATFGTVGNVLPALLAVVTRVAWAAALLWMLGTGVAEVLVGSGLVTGLGRLELSIAAAAVALVVAALIAGFGFAAIAVVSAVVSALSAVLIVGLIVITLPAVDLAVALSVPDGDWFLLLSGAVLVFSVVGLAWANSSGDIARYQAKGTYGSSAVLWTAFGATIPAFLLISWGAVLAASNPIVSEGLQSNPIDLVSRLLPLWYPAPLIAAIALSVICAAALALYSGGFALLASGLRAPRTGSVLIAVVLTGAVLAALLLVVPDVAGLFRDVVTTLAVPVAAWAGIFGAETMIRTRRVHSPSLLRSGGVYPAVRWVNLVMLIIITALGWGVSTASLGGLQWQGFLFAPLGIDPASTLAQSDPGVLLALLLGLLVPLIAGIPALRRLQSAERAATEAEGSPVELVATTGAIDPSAP